MGMIIPVQPTKPFSKFSPDEIYSVSSLHENPRVANGLISPSKSLFIEISNFSHDSIEVHPQQKLTVMELLIEHQLNSVSRLSHTPHHIEEEQICLPDLSYSDLNDIQKAKLVTLIKQYPQVFTEKLGRTHLVKQVIELQPGTQSANTQPYRLSPSKKAIVDQQLEEMLQAGHITPSHSPWASPIVLSPKKDGTLRFCVDYRKLNANTIRTAYPMPQVDDTLDSLREAAFITHRGLYEFLVMPFGLSNAPATFQRLMDLILAGIKWQSCLVYIDDIVVFSSTFEQHLKDLSSVFDRLKTAGLTLKASKCDFCRKELKYLGHIITPDGIKPEPGLIDSVKLFPQPTRLKDIQSFLGLTGYYRKFIKDYAKIRSHQKSKRPPNNIEWSVECTIAFERLKTALTQAPILRAPNFNEPFILETDACDYGLGTVLTQEYDNKKFVIAYASRTQTAAERNYFPTEKEALAIYWATKHFRPYLEGTKIYIRSDCRALQWLLETKDSSGRLARWAISLSAFNITNMTERVNRNLKPMLAQYAQENPQSWDQHLSKLAFSIRTSVNETTGDTLAYLNFGRDPKLPPHLLLTTPTHDVPLLPTSLSSEIENYKQQLRHQLLTSHQFAQEHSELAWTLSSILNATTVNRFSFLPSSNETNPSTISSTISSSKENSTPDTLASHVSHITAPAQSNTTLKRQLSHETIIPQPLMSLQLDVNEPPLHNAPANPIPLMSFYAPPCSTKSHLQRKPRLYSTVCSQAPQANTNTSQHVTNHRSDTSSTTFNTINSSTQQQERATVFSPNHDQPSPGLSSAFNTEMIELS
ncbi:unnamed protein product [Rotaria sp. Silwood1]|nr:unnamed protein product [Rotaria sp. Silwood1]CAF1641149.1 unnamed protein product [Rotaria sp. Silwood1]